MQIVKTKRHGLEVYIVYVNNKEIAQFMSLGGAVTFTKSRGYV